ncbi:hypothetical protein NNO_0379 [Hydrogenimonas sp.]|nr:hypothetical protein NNO_0379 [Hydrogenimonas sp.]
MFMMATEGNTDAEIDGTKLEEARNAVSQIFSIADPISSDPTENLYADVIEAFHAAAEDANLPIQQLVEDIAEDAADGELGDDSVYTETLALKMDESNVTTPFVEAVVNIGTFIPDSAGTTDDVAVAKALFQDLRTQGNTLFSDGGVFDTEAKAMGSATQNVTVNGDLASLVLGNLMFEVFTSIDNNLTDVNTTFVTLANGDSRVANLNRTDLNASVWNYTITDDKNGTIWVAGSGTITLPTADPSTIDPNTFTTVTAAFDGTIPATMLYETNQSQQTFQANVTLTKTTDGAQMEVGDINLSTADGTMLGIKGFKADVGYDYNASNINDPFKLNYVKLNEVTLNGALDSNYTATATLNVAYTMNTSLATNGGFTEVYTTHVGGHVGCYDSNFAYYGDFNNSSLTIVMDDNSSYDIVTDSGGSFSKVIEGKEYYYNDFSAATIIFIGSCPSGSSPFVDGLWSNVDADMKVGNNGYIPNSISLNGTIRNVQSGTELDGTVAVTLLNAADMNLSNPDNVNDEPATRTVVSGVLKRTGLDDLSLNITHEFDPATGLNTGSVAYVYGAMTVNIDGTYNENSEDGNITITSGNGVTMTVIFNNGDIDYDATTPLERDGRVIGRLDNDTGIPRIKYIDGSFESLP